MNSDGFGIYVESGGGYIVRLQTKRGLIHGKAQTPYIDFLFNMVWFEQGVFGVRLV